MKFYRLLDRLPWVRESLERKLGFTLFVASQLTLLIYITVKFSFGSQLEPGILLLIASFNLGSWVAAYVAMRFLLHPIEATAETLRAYLEGSPVDVLPQDGHDIFGQLMRDAEYLGRRAEVDSTHLTLAIDDDLITGLYSRRAGERHLMEDVARSERGMMKFHLAYFALQKTSEIGARYGNSKIDALLQHVAGLFRLNIRRGDWVARWSDQLFVVGFCDMKQIHDAVGRIHQIIEQSPFSLAPGEMHSPVAICGVCEHVAGMELEELYDLAGGAIHRAERALDSSERSDRVVVIIPEPRIDPELAALMEV